ncbi:anti-sigma regulatory factor [Lasius niger]|uniref:Anti-sigma regulatory factor n=1 Tax=Lasius niger TaxID=67767 RepID=A0A0J7JZ15_LASNI|nr:anti-sigma regulatory factor [Lasius niger]
MRSSTKAKNALIKNHAKETGGPASSQVLTETDQNVLALMGSTVVEGHKTVQESNVQIEWIDDSIVYEVDDGEDGENFPIKYKSQEITQHSVS